jgi:hypothetical protein
LAPALELDIAFGWGYRDTTSVQRARKDLLAGEVLQLNAVVGFASPRALYPNEHFEGGGRETQ